ncbi:hypothetical protein SBADM41S_08492 [Streptomyces badius]
MAASVVHASVFGAVLASMRTLSTRLVVFDTAVVDLTDQLDDPVDVLFGTQLGGGTDINRALAYCQSRITRPADTVVVLISDLYEGGIREEMLKRVAGMKASGMQVVTLLALSDEGSTGVRPRARGGAGALGRTRVACTPDLFPDVMAAAIGKKTTTHTGQGAPTVARDLRDPHGLVQALTVVRGGVHSAALRRYSPAYQEPTRGDRNRRCPRSRRSAPGARDGGASRGTGRAVPRRAAGPGPSRG